MWLVFGHCQLSQAKNPPCFSEWIYLYLKEKGDRERTTWGGGLSLCHCDQWQKPALSNGSSKIGTPSPLEDGDRSILQNVVGLLAPGNEQCSKNQAKPLPNITIRILMLQLQLVWTWQTANSALAVNQTHQSNL